MSIAQEETRDGPTAPADSPGYLLWRVTLAWQRRVAAALKPLALTHPQFVLLTVTDWLTAQEGPPTQRRIADHAGTDPMTTSQVLRTLESKGLVERIPDRSDARAKRVRTTDEGQRLVAEAVPAVEHTDAAFFAVVSRPEALAMLTALSALNSGPGLPGR
jgi:DNA-binding MarR family transcriptional regulator